MHSQSSPAVIFDQDGDTLIFPDNTSFLNPEALQYIDQTGDMNNFDPAYATNILNDWLSGPPFPWDDFEGGFETGQQSSHGFL